MRGFISLASTRKTRGTLVEDQSTKRKAASGNSESHFPAHQASSRWLHSSSSFKSLLKHGGTKGKLMRLGEGSRLAEPRPGAQNPTLSLFTMHRPSDRRRRLCHDPAAWDLARGRATAAMVQPVIADVCGGKGCSLKHNGPKKP